MEMGEDQSWREPGEEHETQKGTLHCGLHGLAGWFLFPAMGQDTAEPAPPGGLTLQPYKPAGGPQRLTEALRCSLIYTNFPPARLYNSSGSRVHAGQQRL